MTDYDYMPLWELKETFENKLEELDNYMYQLGTVQYNIERLNTEISYIESILEQYE